MPQNIYDYLVGAPPGDEDQQRQVAELLRGRQRMGMLGQLTGDKVLAPFGKSMSGQADDYAKQLQGSRQKGEQRRVLKKYYAAQGESAKTRNAEAERHNRAVENTNSIRAQAYALAQSSKGKSYTKVTAGQQTAWEKLGTRKTGLKNMMGTFKDEYVATWGRGPQSRLKNAIAMTGLGTDAMHEANDWLGGWRGMFTLEARNELFGATLTANEQTAWDQAADIHAGMPSHVVKGRMQALYDEVEAKALKTAKIGIAAKHDPNIFAAAFDIPELFTEDLQGEDDELTAMEAELERLRSGQ